MDNTPAVGQKWDEIIPKALSTLRDLGVIHAFFFHIIELYLSFHLLNISHIYPFSFSALQPRGLKSPTPPLHEFHTQGQLYPSHCSCLLLHSECLYFSPISSNSPPQESLFLPSQAEFLTTSTEEQKILCTHCHYALILYYSSVFTHLAPYLDDNLLEGKDHALSVY